MKQDFLQIRISEQEKTELNEIVAYLPGDVTVSQFVRDAFREKIARVRQLSQVVGVDVTKDGITAEDGNGKPVDLSVTTGAAA